MNIAVKKGCIDMQVYPVEAVLYGSFIKYEALNRLVATEFAGSSATSVNIYIDLQHMFRSALGSSNVINDNSCLASIALNYCAHLREFFRKIGVRTRIILVWASTISGNNTKFIPEYNYGYINKIETNDEFRKFIEFNTHILRTITPYLHDIYYTEGTVESGVSIKNMIDNVFNDGNPNIVISNSEYVYQLPCYCPCVVFAKRRSNNGEDASISINAMTAIYHYVYKLRRKHTDVNDIHPVFISTVMCMIGMPKRNVKRIISYGRVSTLLRNINPQTYPNTDMIYSQIVGELTGNEMLSLNFNEFDARFKCIDVNYQSKMHSFMSEYNDRTFLTRLNDPDAVKLINNNFFIENPIDLQRL